MEKGIMRGKGKMQAPDHESYSESMKPARARSHTGQGKLVTEDVRVKKAKNGGFIATVFRHSMGPSGKGDMSSMPMGGGPEDYAFGAFDELATFLKQEFEA